MSAPEIHTAPDLSETSDEFYVSRRRAGETGYSEKREYLHTDLRWYRRAVSDRSDHIGHFPSREKAEEALAKAIKAGA